MPSLLSWKPLDHDVKAVGVI